MADPLKFIEALQQKSETARRSIAMVVVVLLMAIIVSLWIYTFSVANLGGSSSAGSETALSSGEPSPFALLWNFLSDSAKNLFR